MKGNMNAKVLLSLAVLALTLGGEAAILYRGRLAQGAQGSTVFPADAKYRMTFRVYETAQGGVARYAQTTNNVPVGTDGGFEVLLDSPALDAVFTNGLRRAYVGLALDDERELMPRRQILALPKVLHANVADAPGYRSHAEKVWAGEMTVADCLIAKIDIGGTLTTTGEKDALAIGKYAMKTNDALDVAEHPITALGEKTQFVSCTKKAYACGDKLAEAPFDGLAFVCLKSAGESTVGFSRTVFCRKGDPIVAPAAVGASDEVLIRVYSFATK